MPATELILITGDHYEIDGSAEEVERQLLDASRGSLLELVWLSESETGRALGVNPAHIVAIRAVAP